MGTIRASGIDIAYRRSGAGAPMVLVHGAFGDSTDWDAVTAVLETEHEVIAWDAPGCGGSDDVPPGWTDRDWADALAGFIEGLGLSRPVAVGHSLGSVLVLLLARDHPDAVRALVLAGPYAGWAGSLPADEVDRRIAAMAATVDAPAGEWADAFLATSLAADTPPEIVDAARRRLFAWRPATTRALLDSLARLDLRPGLQRIAVPALVVRGEADARSPWSAAMAIARTIPGARFVELKGLGHDCMDAAFARTVAAFVAHLPAAAPARA